MHAVEVTVGDNFTGDRLEIIGEGDDVVAVPAHAAADVQQNLRQKLEHARNLVSDGFRGMEMAGVEAKQLAARDGVAEIEFVRANGATLRADAKEFRLNGVEVVLGGQWLLEDGVERGSEAFAGRLAIGGRVLETVGNPEVGHAGCAERLADRGADFARANAVCDPKLADGLVRVREGEAIGGLGMREASRIEVEAEAVRFRPVDPVHEVVDFDFVSVHALAAELAINRMQVHTMFAGDKRKGLFDVGAQFIRCARLAGVVARDGKAASERAVTILEPAYVVALPAVKR